MTETVGTPGLTVAVTGPTGTFGFGLIPLLEADARIGRTIGIARRPFDPAVHDWLKMTYRQGDVRDPAALDAAFQGADVVVHLAFLITGAAGRDATRAVNVDGTINAFRAAADAGARRFVYASSVAAYGFHPDNPVEIDERWPARPDPRFFYAQEKAEIERLLHHEAAARPAIELYALRPSIVLGPHAVGAKDVVPRVLRPLLRRAADVIDRLPVALPLLVPALPMQFVHEDDVGQALLQCVVAAGPAGTYNIAGDGVVTAHDVAREIGLTPLPLPVALAQRAASILARVPRPSFVPPVTEWVEALSRPVIMDTTKAKAQLGWRPTYTGIEALRATLRPAD